MPAVGDTLGVDRGWGYDVPASAAEVATRPNGGLVTASGCGNVQVIATWPRCGHGPQDRRQRVDVQAMLGHTSPVMTLTRYAQPDVEQQQAAAGRVADSIVAAVVPGQNPDKEPFPLDNPTKPRAR